MVSSEMTRVRKTYGSSAISGMTSSHHNWGIVGYRMGPFARFMNSLRLHPRLRQPGQLGGLALGRHAHLRLLLAPGHARAVTTCCEDELQERRDDRLLVERPRHHARAPTPARSRRIWRTWLKEKGVQAVFIDPFHNYTNAIFDRATSGSRRAWAPTRRWRWRIAYVWITEDTYDKEYVADRTIGFDEFKAYVLGETDGVPKTPEWAAEEYRRRGPHHPHAGARVGDASARSSPAAPGAARAAPAGTAYGTEWARMMVLLQAMQGLGKPGVTIWGTAMGAPCGQRHLVPRLRRAEGRMSHSTKAGEATSRRTPPSSGCGGSPCPTPSSIGRVEWDGAGFCGQSLEQQFMHFVYPCRGLLRDQDVVPLRRLLHGHDGRHQQVGADVPEPQARVRREPGRLVQQRDPHGRRHPAGLHQLRARRHRRVRRLRRLHHARSRSGNNYRVIVREQKCIEPLGESKSDYEIFADLAEKLGVYDEYTDGGKTEIDWAKAFYDMLRPAQVRSTGRTSTRRATTSSTPPEDYKPTPSLRWFHEGRACDTPDTRQPQARHRARRSELGTYSGKIEFASESLKANTSRTTRSGRSLPAVHPELGGPRHDGALREVPAAAHVAAPALLLPQPPRQAHRLARRHPGPPHQEGRLRLVAGAHQSRSTRTRAASSNGDIVRLYNDRGSVLCVRGRHRAGQPGRGPQLRGGGQATIRSSRARPTSIDKGGCVNMLTPSRMVSPERRRA